MSTSSTKLEPRGVNTDATFTFANLSITSNVTTANLTVVGKTNLGDISNIKIDGGVSGQVVQTDGSGGLAWVDVSSVVGQAAGPGNAIQFNDGGTINGDSKLKFNKTSGVLTVTGNVSASNVIATYFEGNGSLLSSITGSNVTGSVANAVFATSATTATTATRAGTVTANAQPNITSIGTLLNLDVSDTITATTINSININGTIKTASQPEITSLGTLTGLAVSGTTQTTTLTATNINGTIKTASQPEITSLGTMSSLRVAGIGNINTLRTDIIQYSNGATYQFAMTPPGFDTQVTFNDGGSYGASSNLYYNKTLKTLTVDKIISNGSQLTNLTAGNIIGTIPSTVLGNSTFYIGTTSIKANRASGSQSLTGITSIDGSAASAAKLTTSRNINGVAFDGTSDITIPTIANAETLTGTTLNSTVLNSSLTSLGTLTGLTVSGNVSFTGANVSLGAVSNIRITGGSSGAVLSTDGSGALSWTSVPIIPSQSGQSGNYLTTNGSTLSWASIGGITLPSVTGQSGKYLTNDGTVTSWATGAVYTAISITNGTSNIIIPTSGGPVRTYVGTTLKLDVNSTNVLINGSQLAINIATGTAPMVVTSTTRVANLNVARSGLADQMLMNDGTSLNGSYYIAVATGKTSSQDMYGSLGLLANPSTGELTTSGNITAPIIKSTTTTGNAPLTISSTTRVANLNVARSGLADQMLMNDGGTLNGSYYVAIATGKTSSQDMYGSLGLIANPSAGTLTTSGNITAPVYLSTATTTAPLVISSTTRVANLNVARSGLSDQLLMNEGSTLNGSYYIAVATGKTSFQDMYGSLGLLANPATGTLTTSGNITAPVYLSTATTTAPLVISSTTRVANLNVARSGLSDQLLMNDGTSLNGSYYVAIATGKTSYQDMYATTGLLTNPSTGTLTTTGNITAPIHISTATTGTAPLVISSTTRVANLNVAKSGLSDQLFMNDGGTLNGSYYIAIATSKTTYMDMYASSSLLVNPSLGTLTTSGNINAPMYVSTATTTAPFAIASTVRVANLNVAKSGLSDQLFMNNGDTLNGSYYIAIATSKTTYMDMYASSSLLVNPSLGTLTTSGNITAPIHVSTVATGTAPFAVASTTRVANLNVAKSGLSDQLFMNNGDTLNGSYYIAIATSKTTYMDMYASSSLLVNPSAGTLTTTGTITAPVHTSTVLTGTAPLIVSSTTRVANLNVAYAGVSDYVGVTTQTTGTYYPLFVNGTTTANYALNSNSALKFDAATGNLSTTVVYVTANVTSGNASLGNLATANYVTLNNNITTPNASIGNITSSINLQNWTTLQQSTEVMVSPVFASTITCDLNTGAIFYISPTANFTVNFTNVPTTVNRTIVVTLILSQTTGYYANIVQIGGAAQTVKWANNTSPTPTANKTEIQSITLIRTSAGAWVVLSDYGTYG